MKRVTGIGGVFFKSQVPKASGAWYKAHLGIDGVYFDALLMSRVAAQGA